MDFISSRKSEFPDRKCPWRVSRCAHKWIDVKQPSLSFLAQYSLNNIHLEIQCRAREIHPEIPERLFPEPTITFPYLFIDPLITLLLFNYLLFECLYTNPLKWTDFAFRIYYTQPMPNAACLWAFTATSRLDPFFNSELKNGQQMSSLRISWVSSWCHFKGL